MIWKRSRGGGHQNGGGGSKSKGKVLKVRKKALKLISGGPSSTDPNAPIYGTRFRLKSSFDPTTRLTEKPIGNGALAVVAALKKYGMFLADGVCQRLKRKRRHKRGKPLTKK
jgi:hypothetical protein